MSEKIFGVGIIGCGTFCDAYLSTLGPVYKNVKPVCCSDLNMDAARDAAERWGVGRACTTEELMHSEDVDIVLILTNPGSHYSLTMQALAAGKHVFCEKPMATSLEEANDIVAFAQEKGLYVSCAPDTFLSGEFQTVKKLIDEGAIGTVSAVVANYVGPGPDLWHPNAPVFYKAGGGPALDMGPYFLTTLVSLLGPIDNVFCYANRGRDVRFIQGKDCPVDVYTNYCAAMRFKSGAVGSFNMSFDMWKSDLPALEIYGTDGVILAPDPNTMMGPIKLLRQEQFRELVASAEGPRGKLMKLYGPDTFSFFEEIETIVPRFGNQRGIGVFDMANAIAEGRKSRVSAELCRHVTEAINAFNICADTGLPYQMTTTCEKPEALFK